MSSSNTWSKGERIALPNGTNVEHFTYAKNGMQVLICEMHTAPITGYMRVVNAGSKDEAAGHVGAGIAHFIEHMAFRIDGGKYWKLEKMGHEDNAMTNETSTRFYDYGNSKHINDVISVDASRFLTNEVPADGIPIEMKAVLNEEERGREATGVLFRHAQAVAHLFSRYHYPTIGMRHDIENTTALDMKKFREQYYKLNNSTFIVVGHNNTQDLLSHFESVYGHVPMEEKPNHSYPAEPLQTGRRTVNVKMPAPCSMMCMTWVSPPANTKESVAMSVLQYIISNGDSGRKRKLIDSAIIHNVGCYAPRNIDPYIFCLHGAFEIHDEQTLVKGENAIFHMLKDISTDLANGELETARKSLYSDWAVVPFKTIHSTLMALGEAVDLGNWKDLSSRLETLKTVTVNDIRDVINKYLDEDKATTVRVFPVRDEKLAAKTSELEPALVQKAVVCPDQALRWCCNSSVQTKGNAVLQTLETSGEDIQCSISMPYDHGQRSVALSTVSLMVDNCLYKNVRLGANEIASKMADLGIEMRKDVGMDHVHFTFVLQDSDKFTEATEFVTDGILKNTFFNANGLETKKRNNIAEIASLVKNQQYTTKKELMTSLFTNTRYSDTVATQIDAASMVTVDKVEAFYKKYMQNPTEWKCTLTHPTQFDARSMVKQILSTCKLARSTVVDTVQTTTKWEPNVPKAGFNQVVMHGFGSSTVFMGQVTDLKMYDKCGVALQLGVQALGGGMTARLMSILRGKDGDKNGVYGVYASTYEQAHAPTYVVVNATFTPGLQQHGMNELKYEVNRWNTAYITNEELNNCKKELLGGRALQMDNFENVSGVYHNHLLNNKEPTKEWNDYVTNVKNTTLKEVTDAIKLLDPDKWMLVSTGPVQMSNHLEDSDVE
jgi:zinc protease